MVKHGNIIILVKIVRPREVVLPNARRFSGRCKRTDQNASPANNRIRRTYSGRQALGRRARNRRKTKPANHIRGRAFKSFAKKLSTLLKK